MAKKKTRKRPAKKTVRHPAVDDIWRQSFQQSTFRTNFQLFLSEAMIEFLCAVADDVTWDRGNFLGIHRPDNWLATSKALIKRGLVVSLCTDEREAKFQERWARYKETQDRSFLDEGSYWALTPAGEAVVQLFKVTGVFVEADAAITKKLRA